MDTGQSEVDKVDMDSGQSELDKVDNTEGQIIYRCLDCEYEFLSRGAAVKHRQRTRHRVDGVDTKTGQVVDQIGKGKKGPRMVTATIQKPNLTNESGADIKEHAKGFAEPEDEVTPLFVAAVYALELQSLK